MKKVGESNLRLSFLVHQQKYQSASFMTCEGEWIREDSIVRLPLKSGDTVRIVLVGHNINNDLKVTEGMFLV
jgi:hypothetical protein